MSENALTTLAAELEKLILEYNRLIDVGMGDRIKAEVTDPDERDRFSEQMGYRNGLQGALDLVTATLVRGVSPAGRRD